MTEEERCVGFLHWPNRETDQCDRAPTDPVHTVIANPFFHRFCSGADELRGEAAAEAAAHDPIAAEGWHATGLVTIRGNFDEEVWRSGTGVFVLPLALIATIENAAVERYARSLHEMRSV